VKLAFPTPDGAASCGPSTVLPLMRRHHDELRRETVTSAYLEIAGVDLPGWKSAG